MGVAYCRAIIVRAGAVDREYVVASRPATEDAKRGVVRWLVSSRPDASAALGAAVFAAKAKYSSNHTTGGHGLSGGTKVAFAHAIRVSPDEARRMIGPADELLTSAFYAAYHPLDTGAALIMAHNLVGATPSPLPNGYRVCVINDDGWRPPTLQVDDQIMSRGRSVPAGYSALGGLRSCIQLMPTTASSPRLLATACWRT